MVSSHLLLPHTSSEFHQLIPANKDFKLVSILLQGAADKSASSSRQQKQLWICVGFIYWTLTPPSLRLHV